MICWTNVCNGCSASLPKCIQLSGPFRVLLGSGNQRRGATMNCDGRGKWADILTLLGRAVSEHEAQMNSVHLLQRDCHLGESSGYYIT